MSDENDPIAKAAYNELADTYAEEIRSNPYNAYLEFPGTTSLIPSVEGQRVLDAGCGTGVYTEWLLEQGAAVVGVDASPAMLEYAQDRLGDEADFYEAELGAALDFADGRAFDGIVSALALGYVKDWHQTFAEFERILKPGGFVVFSTAHPFDQFHDDDDDGTGTYFDVELCRKEWEIEVPYYRRPLSEIINPLLKTGFELDSILEPPAH